ncbi:MAG TPA: alpha/beta hydrolase, partial [Mycobacteriales bacterium]
MVRTSVHVTRGTADGPVAAMLPGSGSTADFVTRAFGPALDAAGFTLAVADPQPGPGLVAAAFAALDRAAARYDVRLVGGVSLGAHVAARWAAG